MSLSEGVNQNRPPSQPLAQPGPQGPQGAQGQPQVGQGLLQGQPVQQAPVNQGMAQQIPQGRQRANAMLVPQQVQPGPLGPTAQEVVKGMLPTAQALRESIGTDPRKDVKLGPITFAQSTHYKDVLGQLEALHDTVGRVPAQPTATDLGTVIAQIEVLDRSLESYASGSKTTHHEPMAKLREAAQEQADALRRLQGEMAQGKPWPQGLSLPHALAYLAANPRLTLDELGVACRHGLTAADVKAYADSRVSLTEANMPTGMRLHGELTRLGSGATATVYKGNFVTGPGLPMQGVLKADQLPDHLPPGAEAIGIDPAKPNFALRNVATSKLNDLLGFKLVPHTELFLHDGKLCTVMGLAKGKSPMVTGDFTMKLTPGQIDTLGRDPALLKQFANANGWIDARIEDGKLRVVNTATYEDFDDQGAIVQKQNERDTVVAFDFKDPNLRRELTRLQWFDILCGQADRHAHNYFVSRDPLDGKMHVTAIDNDMAFGKLSQNGNSLQGQRGLNGAKMPEVIDQETADALMKLDPRDVQQALSGMLSPEEIQATLQRLADIQRQIPILMGGGQVYTTDYEWTTPECDKALGVPDFKAVDQRIQQIGKGFSFGMPQMAKMLDATQVSSYVARDQTVTTLAISYKSDMPTIFPEQMQ